jgi:hypothetical protein
MFEAAHQSANIDAFNKSNPTVIDALTHINKSNLRRNNDQHA